MAQESSMSRFPHESFSKKLVALVQQPAEMEISNEIKLMAIQSVISIMDIYPNNIGIMVQLGIGAAIKDTIEQSMGYIDLVEQCIKCAEKISQDSPRDILKHGILTISLNMIDFFDKSTQQKILYLLLNVSSSCQSEIDFQQNFLPVIPIICQMMQSGVQSESDSQKIEKLSIVLHRLASSFSGFINPLKNFNSVGQLFEMLANSGVFEIIIEIIEQYSNYLKATQSQHPKLDEQMINTEQTRQTFSEQSISNLLNILKQGCQYSHLIVMKLTNAGIFDLIEPLLPIADGKEHQQIVMEVLLLCQHLLPSDDIQNGAGEVIQLGIRSKFIYYSDKKFENFLADRKNLENQKKQFFSTLSQHFHSQLAQNLLPKIFVAYSQQINVDFRTKCLLLIQRMITVVPKYLLKESLDPERLTKFIHMTLSTQQPQHVLCCLKIVQELLQSDYGTQLAIYFIRHGIRETIQDYNQANLIEKLNKFESQDESNIEDIFHKEKASFLHMTDTEKQRISSRLQEMQSILSVISGDKKEDLLKLITKHEASLKALEVRRQELKSLGQDLMNEKEEIASIPFGTRISEIAKEISDKYFDNPNYWANVQQLHPNQANLFQKLCDLASNIKQDAANSNFDHQCSFKLFETLVEVLNAGLTSYEFQKSGLLHAIQVLLTMSPTQASIKYEEVKSDNNEPIITSQAALAYIMRLKLFINALCQKNNKIFPFKELLVLCLDQLTLSEPMIFCEETQNQQGQAEALHQLSKSVIVNLIYDQDGEHCGVTQTKTSTNGLPFNHLQADIQQRSQLYQQRNQLYNSLKQVPISIQKCDSINLLQEFLLKRVRTKEDVASLISQTKNHMTLFKAPTQKLPIIEAQYETLLSRCIERMSEFIEECHDEEAFNDLQSDFIDETLNMINDWEADSDKKVTESFWKHFEGQTETLIKSMILQDQEEDQSDEIEGEEMELLLNEIQVKTDLFVKLIRTIKSKSTKQEADESMDEIAEENSESHPDPSEDVEMTEENVKESEESEENAEMSEEPSIIQHQQEQQMQQEEQQQQLQTIEQLLKENNNDDVEIQFYYNNKCLSKSTTFYEICKEHLSSGFDNSLIGECCTIYFMIKDKKPLVQHKDSLIDYTQIRKRTKSKVVGEINAKSLDQTVLRLLNEFSISGFKSNQDSSLLNCLKLTKVLYFIYQNYQMFTSMGINFMLLESKPQTNNEDFSIFTLQSELGPNAFVHSKLDKNMRKVIQDPYQLVSGGINDNLKSIFSSCSFLFSFETKLLYLRLVSFIQVDLNRSLFYLRQHIKRHGVKKQTNQNDRIRQVERQKVRVDRNVSIVSQSLKMIKEIRRKSILEVVYKDEEGTGIGPTLEFYSTVSNELRSDTSLWRSNTMDGTLFPKGIQITNLNEDQVQQICQKFYLAGALIARTIFDDRLMNLSISQLMWDLLLLKKKNILDLRELDEKLFQLFADLQIMANRKHEIEEMDLPKEQKLELISQIKSSKNSRIEDYDLSFYDPLDDSIELVKDGRNIAVTMSNLQEYIDLVLDSTFNESIRLQLAAFRKGFNTVMPIEFLKIFQNKDEVETLVCGEPNNSKLLEWNSLEALSEVINTAHGYNQKSKSFINFLVYITQINPKDRAAFLQFVTGSPRLPIGGFGGLEPRLTVVLKKPSNVKEKADQILPSVMTCQNYIKMPEYSSLAVLKQKFDVAIQEGSYNFTLS